MVDGAINNSIDTYWEINAPQILVRSVSSWKYLFVHIYAFPQVLPMWFNGLRRPA